VSHAIAAELFKLRTTRTTWAISLGILALVAVISVVAALAGDYDADDESPAVDLLAIGELSQVFGLVLGILVVATEFRHGTITPSLLVVPDRVRLVLAKLAVGLIGGFLLGLIVSLVCAALVLPLLGTRDVATGVDAGDVARIVAGNAVATALFAGIGVGLGALLRNQVAAIVGALGYLFVVEPLLGIIPGFSDVISRWFPSGAADATGGGGAFNPNGLDQVPGGLLLAAYTGLFVVAGLLLVRRKDVSA